MIFHPKARNTSTITYQQLFRRQFFTQSRTEYKTNIKIINTQKRYFPYFEIKTINPLICRDPIVLDASIFPPRQVSRSPRSFFSKEGQGLGHRQQVNDGLLIRHAVMCVRQAANCTHVYLSSDSCIERYKER